MFITALIKICHRRQLVSVETISQAHALFVCDSFLHCSYSYPEAYTALSVSSVSHILSPKSSVESMRGRGELLQNVKWRNMNMRSRQVRRVHHKETDKRSYFSR
jgi:hypothetical protein